MKTDTLARQAKPKDKPYKIQFEGGLYLYVSPSGGKLWRYNYRFAGKRKTLSFGAYPIVSLVEARARREEAKKLLANGADPGAVKKAQKAAIVEQKAVIIAATENTFANIARDWFELWKTGVAPTSAVRSWSNLERYVFPDLGNMPIAEVRPMHILKCLRQMEARGLGDSVQKAKATILQVMRYAVNERELAENVPDLKGSIKSPEVKHMAAPTDPVAVGKLLRAIDGYQGRMPEVRAALRLAPLFFVRPGELRGAKWADIDLEAGEWSYTATKTKTPHIVPLARQAVEILRDLKDITGSGEFVFPSNRHNDRPISNAAINAALRYMGFDTKTEITGHGFRAMARTLLAEKLRYPPEVIEHQLAHSVPDTLGRAYNRTRFIDDRRRMMQEWADYLDGLRQSSRVK